MEVLLSKSYITEILEAKGISKVEFAKRMGIKRQNVDALLDSQKKDINTVIKMAEVLGMPLMEFIGFEPSPFKIKGFIKVGEQVREITDEGDWFRAEADSGVCTVPYFSGYNEACETIEKFLRGAIRKEEDCSLMGRINGEAVYTIAVTNDYDRDDNNVSEKVGREILVSILSSKKGMTTTRYSTFENSGDLGFMFTEIKGELQDLFYNRNE